jgi:hydroxymethylglutaryl-CoA lyase
VGALAPIGHVRVAECWARDGLQSWPSFVDTDEKIELLNRAIAAGYAEVEVTSMVPSRTVPQFADSAEVLARVTPRDGVGIRVLAPNLRGVERACHAKAAGAPIDTVGFPISASEAHNVANLRMDHETHLDQLRVSIPLILDAGMEPLGAVATSFGCPLTGPVSAVVVLQLASWLHDQGVDRVMLSDTTGLGEPSAVGALFAEARQRLPDVELVAHFHDTRGSGMVNTFAALAAGATTVDACLGGIGGEPASVEQGHSGETGNICTEDLVVLLARCGSLQGVDVDAVIELGHEAERVLGTTLRSQVLRTGVGFLPAAEAPVR